MRGFGLTGAGVGSVTGSGRTSADFSGSASRTTGSAVGSDFLEFQTCSKTHLEKGFFSPFRIINYRGYATHGLGEKAGGHECPYSY